MNRLYPAFLKIEGKSVLVVGGGKVAEQKVKGLLECGAVVTVIAASFTDVLGSLGSQGRIVLHNRNYTHGDLRGFTLVIGATDDPRVQEEISREADNLSIPVNIADKPELCSFYLGSVFVEGDLKVAVSTNGKSPTVGKIIRDKIAEEFSEGYPTVIEKMGEMRSDIQNTFSDYDVRKEVHEQYVRTELSRLGIRWDGAGPSASTSYEITGTHREAPRPENIGKVFLVGAGPGDPELMTVKGLKLLRSAEVVFYDALVSDNILSEIPSTAEKVFVGKRAGAHCMKQEEINSLLVASALEGKLVVRLKGGDPFVFGRGGEEAEALRAAGIEVIVVPGITAGTGIPASLGMPLTHRGESSSVLFLTGHEDPAKRDRGAGWEGVAHADTIVIYMGSRRLRMIADKLIAHGVPDSRPAAVVFNGTLPGERVIVGKLADIAGRVDGNSADMPGLILVGETVRSLARNPFGVEIKEELAASLAPQERIDIVERVRL